MEEEKIVIEQGSGNVFADLGYPDAEEHLAKSKLVLAISNVIKASNMTQAEAAILMGLDQPKVSKLLRGHHRGYSSDRLLHILNLLGQDVVITVISRPPSSDYHVGNIRVAFS